MNADRRPDLKAKMLDGTFQATACAKCGTMLRLPPHLTYLEMQRKLWILVEPASMLEDWPVVENDAIDTLEGAFGAEARESGQAMGERLTPRLVFGWPALREKLICSDLGLEDVTLELMEMAIMRDVQDAPMADQTELRLVGGDASALAFAWVVTASEEVLETLSAPRRIYDGIAEDADAWAKARAKFDDVLLVDLRRLIAGPALAAEWRREIFKDGVARKPSRLRCTPPATLPPYLRYRPSGDVIRPKRQFS